MANTIWKEIFLIMCSILKENAQFTERFPLLLHITDDYALTTLCGEQHNVVNEEGKINGMELNRALRDDDGNLYDIIAGPFLVVGLTEDDFCSLTDEMLDKYSKLYEKPEIFMNLGGKIHVIPMDESLAQDIRM